jgi:O-antigen/teichoic acid export membrane protein
LPDGRSRPESLRDTLLWVAVDVPAPEVYGKVVLRGRGLAAATFEATAFRFGVLPLSFATTIITSRYLLPAGRGSFVLALLTVTLTWTLLSSVMVAITKEIGFHKQEASPILAQGIVLAIVLGLVGGAILLPLNLALSGGGQGVVVIATLALPAMLTTQNVGGALLPLSRFRAWNVLQLLPQLFVLLGMVVLVVLFDLHLKGAVIAWTVAQIFVAAISLFISRDIWLVVFRRNWLRPNRIKPMLKLGLALGVVNLVGTLNYRVELFVLQAYRGVGSVGIYSVAASLAELAWVPVAALASVSTPAIVNASTESAIMATARSVRHTVVLTIGFALLVGSVGILLIPSLFGERFAGARTPLAILLPAIVVFAPTKIIAVYLSGRMGRPGFQLAVAATSTILTATAAAVLVPPLGMSGAAIATCAGYSAGFILEVALLSRFDMPIRSLLPRPEDLRAYRNLGSGTASWIRSRRRG